MTRTITVAPEHVEVGDTTAIRGMVGEVTAVDRVADLVTITIFTPVTRATYSDTFTTSPGRRVLVEREA